MSKFPRITFGIIVLNGEPFTKYCLRQLYPFAHEIIVVEGGSRWAIDQAPEGHSVDGTLEALREFKEQEDPENKVQIITRNGFWEEKTEQSQAFAQRATGDYLWQVDVDEFYKSEDMRTIIEMLEADPSITAVSFNTIDFWGSFYSVLSGWWYHRGNAGEFHRLFKFGDGYTYHKHRPPTVYDPEGRCMRSIHWVRGNQLAKKGIFLYHYPFVFPKQVWNKVYYYGRRGNYKLLEKGKLTRRLNWYKYNYQHITRPFHIYWDETLPSWLYRYNGTHPSETDALRHSIAEGDCPTERRPDEDIQKLLDSVWYQVAVFILKPLSKPSWWIVKMRAFLISKILRTLRPIWRKTPRVIKVKVWAIWSRWKSNTAPIYDLMLIKPEADSKTANKIKRALLSYLVHPFSIPRDDPRFLQHINISCAQEIVRILNELGYVVDVIDYRDTTFIPRRIYDLFIGHGGINFEKIAARLPDSIVKIYFSTGCYWKFSNEQELARFAALRERRGVDMPLDRFVNNSEEGALLIADGVIGLGNDLTRQTYADFSPVIMMNNGSLADDHYEQLDKDFDKGKAHFLYFAGGGPVHKGLDLLLEAFSGLEQHLWICCNIYQQFAEAYSDALHNYPNIHLVGWIQPRSAKFYELMSTCNYVILPSCSEGQASSVVECMNQGLIPVVSQACGVDIGDYGVMLNPCTIEEIGRVVLTLSTYSAAQCKEMSLRARKAAVTDFSEAAFHLKMTDAIQRVISLLSGNLCGEKTL